MPYPTVLDVMLILTRDDHDPTRLVPVGAVHYLNPEGQTRLGLFYAIRSDPATQGKLASLPPAWWGGEGSCMGECPTNQGGRSLPAPPGQ